MFKENDWIIATKPAIRENFSFSLLGNGKIEDRTYMHKPIQVKVVTEAHIIFKSGSVEAILPFDELKERGFIIANEALVKLCNKKLKTTSS